MMNIKHLQMMVVLLNELQAEIDRGVMNPEKFSLGHWETEKDDCGTVACAVGYAMRDPDFIACGLSARNMSPIYINDVGTEYLSWYAVEKFFDICEFDTYHLFHSASYKGNVRPEDVSARLTEFIENGGY